MRQPTAVLEHVGYNRAVREFLQTYHTAPCENYDNHPMDTCLHYHSEHDRRRNPYLDHSFRYYPSGNCSCGYPDCPKTHNLYEEFYHPLKYKTSNCGNPSCQLGLLCWGLHANEYAFFQKTQFFRFDLNTFKTEPCPQNIPGSHELSSCRYYHGEGDRRRNPARVSYSHVECPRGSGCGDGACGKTHNKIEQLYHPSRYKTKYCQNFYQRRGCAYQQFCSFAHSDREIEIELLHLMEQDDYFTHYKYKTVWCPYTQSHNRSLCPYAHNFQDFRRSPHLVDYSPEVCPEWSRGKIESIEEAGCPRRMNCPLSHGWLENKFHPDLASWESRNSEGQGVRSDAGRGKKRSAEIEDLGVGAPFFKSEERFRKAGAKEKGREKQVVLPIFEVEELVWQPQPVPPAACKKKEKNKQKKMYPYSESLMQLLKGAGLADKVGPSRFNHQRKLIAMSDRQISKLDFLTADEKGALTRILAQYSKLQGLQQIKYSNSMVHFFKGKDYASILEKMRSKKVDQRELLNMSPSCIDDCSFLDDHEKEHLPLLIDNFQDDRAFRELKNLIANETQGAPP